MSHKTLCAAICHALNTSREWKGLKHSTLGLLMLSQWAQAGQALPVWDDETIVLDPALTPLETKVAQLGPPGTQADLLVLNLWNPGVQNENHITAYIVPHPYNGTGVTQQEVDLGVVFLISEICVLGVDQAAFAYVKDFAVAVASYDGAVWRTGQIPGTAGSRHDTAGCTLAENGILVNTLDFAENRLEYYRRASLDLGASNLNGIADEFDFAFTIDTGDFSNGFQSPFDNGAPDTISTGTNVFDSQSATLEALVTASAVDPQSPEGFTLEAFTVNTATGAILDQPARTKARRGTKIFRARKTSWVEGDLESQEVQFTDQKMQKKKARKKVARKKRITKKVGKKTASKAILSSNAVALQTPIVEPEFASWTATIESNGFVSAQRIDGNAITDFPLGPESVSTPFAGQDLATAVGPYGEAYVFANKAYIVQQNNAGSLESAELTGYPFEGLGGAVGAHFIDGGNMVVVVAPGSQRLAILRGDSVFTSDFEQNP